ncbi:MAG: hypothetical protein V4543_00115, partial [Bacteroidota bacterium]
PYRFGNAKVRVIFLLSKYRKKKDRKKVIKFIKIMTIKHLNILKIGLRIQYSLFTMFFTAFCTGRIQTKISSGLIKMKF